MLNSERPHLGASPDGLVRCACCGKGVIELKCPIYSHCHDEVQTVANDKGSCLKNLMTLLAWTMIVHTCITTKLELKCEVEYCDFCVCTFPLGSDLQIHIERLSPAPDLWT